MSSKRTKTAQFRVTAEEDAHLRDAAEKAGLKLSDYLRAVSLTRSVVVVGEQATVVIPATTSPRDADEELMGRMRAILKGLQEQDASPAPPTGSPSPPTPSAAAPLPPSSPQPASTAAAPDSPPPPKATSSPSEGDGMVGASSSQEPPAAGAAAPVPAAGAIPGSGETVIRTRQDEHAPGEFEPGGAAACPHCGGTEGRHQSFCEEIRGEPPVEPEVPEGTEPPQPAPPAAPAPETREQFVDRRVEEGELRVVAEAEWRQQEAGVIAAPEPPAQAAPQAAAPTATAERREPCPSCGTLKLPEAQCPDCGRRPG